MVERCLSFRVRRFLFLVLVVMLAFVPICQAYGDDFEGGGGSSSSFNNSFGTVWYGPTGSGGVANILYVRYGVVANTRYDAALYCCKGSNFDLSDLSDKKKVKLLNNADFKQFAELFKVGKPELTDDWSGDASIVTAWNSARQMYGETYCWNARYTNDQKIRAQDAINRILQQDDGQGGSGSGPSGGNVETDTYVLIRVWPYAPEAPYDIHYLAVKKSAYVELQNFAAEHDEILLATVGKDQHEGRVITVPEDDFEFVESDGDRRYFIRWLDSFSTKYVVGTAAIETIDGNKCAKVDSGVGSSGSFGGKNVRDGSWPVFYRNYAGEVEEEPTEPPVEWPAPPTETPKPPDVPTPGDPYEPNPWLPIPDDDIDITGDDFQDLLDALNEHCIHLQNSLESNISQLWDLESDYLSGAFEDLKSYLHELFEWLSEQLNFDVTVEGGQYDDTSVIYWLKQIWSRLPTGINTKPSDPVTNPSGWWDWLTQLLNNLAADLMALGHDSLAGVLETLNQLRSKFPFSLPWDVSAMLGLLVGPAVCPEFDMPCYAVSMEGLQQVGTYHITLEAYESVWQGVKWIETIAFAVYLIMNTGNLMDMVQRTVRPR